MYPMVFEPASALRLWADLCRVGLESQYIISMRTAGMMGDGALMRRRKTCAW